MRTDLGMSKGKMAVQAAHAAVTGSWGVGQAIKAKWWVEGTPKIALKVSSEEELRTLVFKAGKQNIYANIIWDAGLTKFKGIPTLTCGVIGPDEDHKIDEIIKDLKLL